MLTKLGFCTVEPVLSIFKEKCKRQGVAKSKSVFDGLLRLHCSEKCRKGHNVAQSICCSKGVLLYFRIKSKNKDVIYL